MKTMAHSPECLKPLLRLLNWAHLLGRQCSIVKRGRTFKAEQMLFIESLLCIKHCARSWVYNGELHNYVILANSLSLVFFSFLNSKLDFSHKTAVLIK